jgi:hypothetical protein
MSDTEIEVADVGTSLTRTLAELARIDGTHTTLPVCGLCGQRVNTLDKFGLCSKVSNAHRAEREVGAA